MAEWKKKMELLLLVFASRYIYLTLVFFGVNSAHYPKIRELPRVMQIYDIVHMGEGAVRTSIRSHFYNSANIRDERVIDMLLEKGYIDLEDTLLQHKQKNHLMLLFEGPVGTHQNIKQLTADSTPEEQFMRLS